MNLLKKLEFLLSRLHRKAAEALSISNNLRECGFAIEEQVWLGRACEIKSQIIDIELLLEDKADWCGEWQAGWPTEPGLYLLHFDFSINLAKLVDGDLIPFLGGELPAGNNIPFRLRIPYPIKSSEDCSDK